MWASGHLDIHDPDVIADYYRRLFHDTRDRAALTRAISGEDYETVQREYQLIRKQGVQVIVPYDVPLFQEIAQQAEQEGLTAKLIKLAAPITVSSYEEAMVKQHCASIRWHGGVRKTAWKATFSFCCRGMRTVINRIWDFSLPLPALMMRGSCHRSTFPFPLYG